MNNFEAGKSSNDFMLENEVEAIVKEKTKELMKTIDMCQCETCYYNACAIALNKLKPMYVTSKRGALISQVNTIDVWHQADLTVEIVKALMIVKENPRH